MTGHGLTRVAECDSWLGGQDLRLIGPSETGVSGVTWKTREAGGKRQEAGGRGRRSARGNTQRWIVGTRVDRVH
jgi:hypothetical protein